MADPVDLHALPGNAHTDAAMANIIRMFLLSGAVGGLGRMAVGARDFLNRNTGEPRHAPPRHSMIPLPYPVPEKLGSANKNGGWTPFVGGTLTGDALKRWMTRRDSSEIETPADWIANDVQTHTYTPKRASVENGVPEFHLPPESDDVRDVKQLHPAPLATVLGGAGDPDAPNVPEDGIHSTETKQAELAQKAAHVLELLKTAEEPGFINQLARGVTETLPMLENEAGTRLGWIGHAIVPQNVKSMMDMPWAYPALAGAVAGGGYLGWHGADKALHAAKDHEEESELSAAKRRFENALLSQAPMKTASYDGLDQLAEEAEAAGFEKQAFDTPDPLHGMLGLYLLTMLGSGAISGAMAHKYFSEASPDRAVEDALKQRRLQLHQAAPRPFVAQPVAVPVHEEDEPVGL